MAGRFLTTIFATLCACLVVTQGVWSAAGPKDQPKPVPLPLFPAEPAWTATLDAPPAADPAMDADHVYVAMRSEVVDALRRDTGARVWRRNIETSWPLLVGGPRLFIAASDEVHGVDAATGAPRWRTPFSGMVTAPMTLVGGTLIVVLDQTRLLALDASDGHELWARTVPAALTRAPPAASDRRFVATLVNGHVVTLDAGTGATLWDRALEGELAPPGVAFDRVLVGTTANAIYALEASTGRTAWQWLTGADVVGADGDRNTVFFASLDNIIRGVNRGNGNQRWIGRVATRPGLPPRLVTSPRRLVYDPVVLVAGVTPDLQTFNAKTGEPLGTYTAPSELQGAPLVDPDLRPYAVAAVVVTRNGQVVALRPTAMLLAEPTLTPPSTALPGRALERERLPVR